MRGPRARTLIPIAQDSAKGTVWPHYACGTACAFLSETEREWASALAEQNLAPKTEGWKARVNEAVPATESEVGREETFERAQERGSGAGSASEPERSSGA